MIPTLQYILACVAIGYLIGCISPSYIVGRLKGYDIRENGSGNAGASNTAVTAGLGLGILVGGLDVGKAVGAWWLCKLLFPHFAYAGMIAGVSAVFGHMFPVFLDFRGGKGMACMAGVMLGFRANAFFVMAGVFIVISLLSNFISIGTVSIAFLWPAFYGIITGDVTGACILLIPAIPILIKHLGNFRRIRSGSELRVSYLWNKEKEIGRIRKFEKD